MPDSPIEEVKAMEDVFNEIHDKTDKEIQKQEDEDAKKASDGAGEPTKDPTPEADPKPAEEDPKPANTDPAKPDTSLEVAALTAKVAELEAKLSKEHQRTSSWDGRIRAANERVKELEAENQALKEAKPKVQSDEEKSEQEVMDSFKATFPEFTEVLAIMQKKIDAKSAPVEAPAKAEPTYDPDDFKVVDDVKTNQPDPQTEHMSIIRKAHPGIDEMVSQGVIMTWINKQPDFIQSHLLNIHQNGSTEDIIKMVTEFQNKTGWKSSLSEKDTGDKEKEDKLKSMLEAEGGSAGPKTDGPDKNDFTQGAKDAGL